MRALKIGVAAGIEHKKVLMSLNNISIIIDIGANKGQFALISRHFFPDAKIISFEPLEKPARLYQSVFLEDKNAILHQVAIGTEVTEKIIHVSGKDDSSSLLPISSLQNDMFPGTAEVDLLKIKVAPLHNFILSSEIQFPALLKIDVQGYELKALKGCEDLLENFNYIYVECSFMELYEGQSYAQDVIIYLEQQDFVLKGTYNMSYDKKGNAVQADFLFINRNVEK